MTGLNGFYLYEGSGTTSPSNATFETGLNTSGTVALALTTGNTYTVQIQDFANLALGIGTDLTVHMDGTFQFDVQSDQIQAIAPEPSSATITITISSGLDRGCAGNVDVDAARRDQIWAVRERRL